ncbi:hypothetical protein GWK47_035175 [Chionoecetes opilio]|uniref:Uncharacterized protein n=1 Tax=Chionoecetes opilio TaxID=41210 RepID=A0A8J4YFK0_CHIOP|nr:hypothetical protein GWK47_035175 [Chionoecetes opilio]
MAFHPARYLPATPGPRLITSMPGYSLGMMAGDRLLPQPSPFLAEPQPWLTTDDVDTEGEEEDAFSRFRKVKMFEIAPSTDPVLEERRQRALYAKKNRDMKKREVAELQGEVAALRAAKDRAQEELSRVAGLAQRKQHSIEELQQSLAAARHQLRHKEEYIRNTREKMSLLKAHLELIAEGLEETNISRRLLLSLLAQIS